MNLPILEQCSGLRQVDGPLGNNPRGPEVRLGETGAALLRTPFPASLRHADKRAKWIRKRCGVSGRIISRLFSAGRGRSTNFSFTEINAPGNACHDASDTRDPKRYRDILRVWGKHQQR